MRIDRAAEILGVGSKTLYAELRRRGILGSKNVAIPRYVKSGDFRVEQRSYYLKGTVIQKHYLVTLVTTQGMSLLQEIADELGTNERMVEQERRRVPAERGGRDGQAPLQRVGPAEGRQSTLDPAGRTGRTGRR